RKPSAKSANRERCEKTRVRPSAAEDGQEHRLARPNPRIRQKPKWVVMFAQCAAHPECITIGPLHADAGFEIINAWVENCQTGTIEDTKPRLNGAQRVINILAGLPGCWRSDSQFLVIVADFLNHLTPQE